MARIQAWHRTNTKAQSVPSDKCPIPPKPDFLLVNITCLLSCYEASMIFINIWNIVGYLLMNIRIHQTHRHPSKPSFNVHSEEGYLAPPTQNPGTFLWSHPDPQGLQSWGSGY